MLYRSKSRMEDTARTVRSGSSCIAGENKVHQVTIDYSLNRSGLVPELAVRHPSSRRVRHWFVNVVSHAFIDLAIPLRTLFRASRSYASRTPLGRPTENAAGGKSSPIAHIAALTLAPPLRLRSRPRGRTLSSRRAQVPTVRTS